MTYHCEVLDEIINSFSNCAKLTQMDIITKNSILNFSSVILHFQIVSVAYFCRSEITLLFFFFDSYYWQHIHILYSLGILKIQITVTRMGIAYSSVKSMCYCKDIFIDTFGYTPKDVENYYHILKIIRAKLRLLVIAMKCCVLEI